MTWSQNNPIGQAVVTTGEFGILELGAPKKRPMPTFSMTKAFIALALITSALSNLAWAQSSGHDAHRAPPPTGDDLVKVSAQLTARTIAPGSEATLAIICDVEPGWHIYWKNNGDSGLPTGFTFKTSNNVRVGEVQWPVPTRKLEPGEILDFVYEGRVIFLAPVKVSKDAAPGTTDQIVVEPDWMVCRDVCLAGKGKAAAQFGIGAAGEPAGNLAVFDAARAKMPLPITNTQGPRIAWDKATLIVQAAGASTITLFPNPVEDLTKGPADLVTSGEAKGEELRVLYRENVGLAGRIGGVIDIKGGPLAGAWSFDIPAPRNR